MIANIMNTQILKVTKGDFYVYFNINLRSYEHLFVLVISYGSPKRISDTITFCQ